MLIGISGSVCSGKHTTAEYLVQHHGFLRLHLPTPLQTQPSTTSTTSSSRQTSTSKPLPKSSDVADAEQNVTLARLAPSVSDQKGTRGLTFPDVDALLEFVTNRWREHWVLTDIYDEATLEVLLRRPFFLLLNVDAPVGVRYARFSERCRKRRLSPMGLADFVYYNDLQLYGGRAVPPIETSTPSDGNVDDIPTTAYSSSGTAHLLAHAHLQILNAFSDVAAYYSFLGVLDLPSPARLRPTWDAYFMTLASLASRRANCMKRRVGCVLVHDARIISTGYNGTPRNLTNCNEGGCARCNNSLTGGGGGGGSAPLSTCLCLHAEENALLEAGRERIRPGSVLYCDTCPCLTCSVKIAQVGVREVVYSQTYNMDEASRRVLHEAGVGLRQFVPPRTGLVGYTTGTTTGGGLGSHDSNELSAVLNRATS